MQRMEVALGRLLLVGVWLSFFIVLSAGLVYLWQQGQQPISYQVFHPAIPAYSSVSAILQGALTFSPLSVIQAGLLLLVIVQLLRVALMGYFFILQQDALYIAISMFIFCVLVYSLLAYF